MIAPRPPEGESQAQGPEVDSEPVPDLRKTGKPASDDGAIGEKDQRHSDGGTADGAQGSVFRRFSSTPSGGQPFATKRLALLLGGPTPDPGPLVGLQGELEAVLTHLAGRAYRLSPLDDVLDVVASGEEEGVGVAGAGGAIPPVGNQPGAELCRTMRH